MINSIRDREEKTLFNKFVNSIIKMSKMYLLNTNITFLVLLMPGTSIILELAMEIFIIIEYILRAKSKIYPNNVK